MLRNFSWNVWPPNNAAALLRLGVGLLAAANLVAGYFVLRPMGGSPDELRQQAMEMRLQIRQQQNALDRMRQLGGKVEIGRGEGDKFMTKYFLPRRTAYSVILAELNQVANEAKVTQKEEAYHLEPVEGSDTLQMMQITDNFEASYENLLRFVNMIDKADRLLIMESLNATPQQGGAKLNVMMKLDTFVVVEDGSAQ
jgi:Tfp pilus assembly protein PilO